jgi:hypothetical protein
MESPTTLTTENAEPLWLSEAETRETPVAAATADIDAAYCDERPSQGTWLSELPPTGVLTGVLGEMAFYYGACWSHHRSAHRPGKTR